MLLKVTVPVSEPERLGVGSAMLTARVKNALTFPLVEVGPVLVIVDEDREVERRHDTRRLVGRCQDEVVSDNLHHAR